MARAAWVLLAIVAAISSSGCGALEPYLRDDLPMAYQRRRIERFDPFPDNSIAPAMVGCRPPDFEQPRTEPVQARWTANQSRWYQGY
ncbi:MAG: hypothetical protein K8T25_15750 [Planctomycetia bacterium]|jgi:hypothetical protein|nr:hypothetical protein [Planctomycetia bacterium]